MRWFCANTQPGEPRLASGLQAIQVPSPGNSRFIVSGLTPPRSISHLSSARISKRACDMPVAFKLSAERARCASSWSNAGFSDSTARITEQHYNRSQRIGLKAERMALWVKRLLAAYSKEERTVRVLPSTKIAAWRQLHWFSWRREWDSLPPCRHRAKTAANQGFPKSPGGPPVCTTIRYFRTVNLR